MFRDRQDLVEESKTNGGSGGGSDYEILELDEDEILEPWMSNIYSGCPSSYNYEQLQFCLKPYWMNTSNSKI